MCSKDRTGPIFYNGRRPDHALFGVYVIHKLVLVMVYLCTKFEDSNSSTSPIPKIRTKNPKFKNRRDLGWLGSRKIVLILGVTIIVL